MSDLPTGKQQVDGPGFDSLVHDVFGLNIRGVRTVWDTTFRPSRTFSAARSADWLGRYTPSIRLVAGLVAIFLLLRFFWEAQDSAIFQGTLAAVTAEIETIISQLPEDQRPPPEFVAQRALEGTQTLFQNWAIGYPFCYIILHLILACFLRIWGEGTSFVTRLRLYFLPLSTVVALIILFTLGHEFYMTSDNMILLTIVNSALTWLIYGLIVFFGLRPVHTAPGARAWRGGLYGAVATGGDFAASVSAAFLGIWVPQTWQGVFG